MGSSQGIKGFTAPIQSGHAEPLALTQGRGMSAPRSRFPGTHPAGHTAPPRRVWCLCKELLEGKLKSRKYSRWRERGPCRHTYVRYFWQACFAFSPFLGKKRKKKRINGSLGDAETQQHRDFPLLWAGGAATAKVSGGSRGAAASPARSDKGCCASGRAASPRRGEEGLWSK